ncbi:MAG: hypothetical protein KGQ51_11940 [Planctomycetes bacterium]|nr:hypothetical protein [Planctomycetota bacterium]
MAKFYVESGSFRGVVDSGNAETAAVWAIHRVMQPPRSQQQTHADGLFRLQDDIRVSEKGFGRSEAKRIETRDAFSNWARLVKDVHTDETFETHPSHRRTGCP